MQGNCVCTKCGAEASSKCPVCRSVFLCDAEITMLRMVLGVDWQIIGEHRTCVVRFEDYIDMQSEEGQIRMLIYYLTKLVDSGRFAQLSCSHSWTFKPGCTSSIGCGHDQA